MRTIIYYFIQGLFYTVPLGLTVYMVVASFNFLDQLIPFKFPGLGFLTMILLITFVGYLGSVILASSVGNLVRKLEKVVMKTPGIKLIYTALKDLTSALTGSSRTFDKAVLVMLDKDNHIQKIGFITKNDLSPFGIDSDMVSVYFPYSYGIMGDLRIVPRSAVKTLPGKPSEIMKFIVSGGVVEINLSDKNEGVEA
jgi:uncharacterized membrane protein